MLILASASPSRRQMLQNVGLDFAIEPSGVDEDEVKLSLLGKRATAQDIATTLAEMKALRVSTRRQGWPACRRACPRRRESNPRR